MYYSISHPIRQGSIVDALRGKGPMAFGVGPMGTTRRADSYRIRFHEDRCSHTATTISSGALFVRVSATEQRSGCESKLISNHPGLFRRPICETGNPFSPSGERSADRRTGLSGPGLVGSRSRRASYRSFATRHDLCHARQMRRRPAPDQVFIESKNSSFDLVWRSLSSRNSMASTVPIGLRIRRRTYIFLSWIGDTSNSSFRVPER